jgi:hypothetical protein
LSSGSRKKVPTSRPLQTPRMKREYQFWDVDILEDDENGRWCVKHSENRCSKGYIKLQQ